MSGVCIGCRRQLTAAGWPLAARPRDVDPLAGCAAVGAPVAAGQPVVPRGRSSRVDVRYRGAVLRIATPAFWSSGGTECYLTGTGPGATRPFPDRSRKGAVRRFLWCGVVVLGVVLPNCVLK